MPSTTGLICAAIVGLLVFGIAWWNRANQRIDATAAPRPTEEPSVADEVDQRRVLLGGRPGAACVLEQVVHAHTGGLLRAGRAQADDRLGQPYLGRADQP